MVERCITLIVNRVMANGSLVFFHITLYDILKRRLPLSLRVTGAALASCVADKPRSCQPHRTQRGHVQRAS